jgi:hypothetical protein
MNALPCDLKRTVEGTQALSLKWQKLQWLVGLSMEEVEVKLQTEDLCP